MKVRYGKYKIDLRSLIRLEWRKFYPKLIVHEKFEKYIKWTLRVSSICSVLISFFVLPYIIGIIVSFSIFILEQILEKTLFEYSIMIVQPFPDFVVDYSQWLTNGYLLANEEVQDAEKLINYFGPVYKDVEYARKFFKYIRSWNQDSDTDKDNNICISFIYESDVSYTTYIYANPDRKWLQANFDSAKDRFKYDKYKKNQQSLVLQMYYSKNLKMQEGMFFTKFIKQQKNKKIFYFAPFFIKDNNYEVIDEMKVLKMHFKIKGRSELKQDELEYHLNFK